MPQQYGAHSYQGSPWDAFAAIGDQFSEALTQNDLNYFSATRSAEFDEFDIPGPSYSTSAPVHVSHAPNHTYPPTGLAIPTSVHRRVGSNFSTPPLSHVSSSEAWSTYTTPEPISPFDYFQQQSQQQQPPHQPQPHTFPAFASTSYPQNQAQFLAPTSNPSASPYNYGLAEFDEPNSWLDDGDMFGMTLPPDMQRQQFPAAPSSAPDPTEFLDMRNELYLPPGTTPQIAAPASVTSNTSSRAGRNRRTKQQLTSGRHAYTCHVCKAGFSAKADLKHHMDTHQPYELRPYPCSACRLRFRYPKDLTRHKQKHEENAPRVFCPSQDCKFAERGFIRYDHLTRHVQTQHRERLEEFQAALAAQR